MELASPSLMPQTPLRSGRRLMRRVDVINGRAVASETAGTFVKFSRCQDKKVHTFILFQSSLRFHYLSSPDSL